MAKSPIQNVQAEFIDMGRTLSDIALGKNLTDDTDLQHMLGRGRGRTWDQLVTEMRVVVLSVAGAGKTREIKDLARRLHAGGKPAFFIRLERIASHFELAFEPGMHKVFQEWLAGADEGWLLLDSVDEARLRYPADFELAVQRMSQILAEAGATGRAHIVLTSRIGAWRPVTDLVLCRDLLPHPTPRSGRRTVVESEDGDAGSFETIEDQEGESDEIAPGFAVVGLDELSDEQIAIFAAAKGVDDPQAFLEEIERKDATAFARRPQDLEDVVQFWLENSAIGTRWEMMSANVARRLIERDQTRAESAPLSPERAREGARTLAAAITLSGVQVIRLPDGSSSVGEGVDISGLLTGWTSAEVNALLQRPIFDPAIYGTVRFHHRSVREFLAAEWFAHLLAKAHSRAGLEVLFFRKKFGIEIVAPLLRPILPWLVAQDGGIRSRVLQVAPEVVFEGGDPARLPAGDRRRILFDVCQLLSDRAAGRSALDYAAVQRFADDADEDLTNDIRTLLRKYANDDEIAPFLLRMVWLGRLYSALPEVLAFAEDASDQGYRRLTALKALRSIADPGTLATVGSNFLLETGDRPRRMVAEILSGLGGSSEDVAWFLLAVERAESQRKHSVDYLASEAATFVSRVDVDTLPALIDGMTALLSRPPLVQRLYNDLSSRFEWLLGPAARAVERLIARRHSAALSQSALSIIRQISAARIYQSGGLTSERNELARSVPGWPELNRAQFWYDVERMRAEMPAGQRLVDWWRPSNFGAVWKFAAEDFDFALEAINSRPFMEDRLVALSLAFELYRLNKRPSRWRAALKRAARDTELSSKLHLLFHPAPDLEMQKYRASERKRQKRQDERKEQETTNLVRSREYLAANVTSIRNALALNPKSAADHGAIHYLFHQMREQRDTVNRWSDYDWSSLKEPFGDPVAEMFRDAARSYWRLNSPQLHNEGAPDNQTPFSTILGLAGLEIETSESMSMLAELTQPEVEVASRYAVSEMNGFPTWFASLFERHPEAVADFLLKQIRYEAFILPQDRTGDGILSDVSWTGQWAWERLGPMLLGMLTSGEPKNAKALGSILKILKESGVADAQLAAMARVHALNTSSSNPGHWFAFWIGVDPDEAIPALESRLGTITDDLATDLAMRTAVRLFGNRFDEPGIARDRFLHPRSLTMLHRILHRYIRRSDDVQRGNSGAYSPDLRDHAQEARDSILDRLRDARGKEAFVGLQDIIDGQPDRPWLRRLLIEKAAREGDIAPFLVEDVHPLAANSERTARAADQLADVALVRLLQIKETCDRGLAVPPQALNSANSRDVAAFVASEMTGEQTATLAVSRPTDVQWVDVIGTGYPGRHRTWVTVVPPGNREDNGPWLEPTIDSDVSRRRTLALVRATRNQGLRWPWAKEADVARAAADAQAQWRAMERKAMSIDDVDIVAIDLTKAASPVIPRDWFDRALEFLRWRSATTLVRLGTGLALLGASCLVGWGEAVVEEFARRLLHAEVDLSGPAQWVGWSLVGIGIVLALIGHFFPRR